MKLALKVRIDGTTEIMDISGDELKAFQAAVGGYVERVSLKWGINLWMDEEGKLKSYRINRFATMLYWESKGMTAEDYDNGFGTIVGDVVITGKDDERGETIPLTDEQVGIWMKEVDKYYGFLNNNRIQDYINPF